MLPIRIAVVGVGPWGLTLTGAFACIPHVQVRWICELDDERRARAGVAHPDARLTAELDEALGDRTVDAVVVAADPVRHHAVGMRALAAGKHLYVEKPLALSARDADGLCAAAEARGLLLTVGHLLLHHPAVRRTRQIVAEGLLGEPLQFSSRRVKRGPPRRLGSAWWALAPHDVSLALHLFDGLPAAVSASGGSWGRAQEDNEASATLQFGGARTANIHVARFANDERRETTIAGTEATLTFDELATADQALRIWTPRDGTVIVAVAHRDALAAQCLEFVSAVARGDAGAGNGAHAADVVRVLEAGERAMQRASTEAA